MTAELPTFADLLPAILILARVAGLVFTAPLLGTAAVPWRVRAATCAAFTMLVAPTWIDRGAALPPAWIDFSFALVSEVLIGVALGLGTQLLLVAVRLAGHLVGQMGGLNLAEAVDPTGGGAVAPIGRLFAISFLAVFVMVDGHRMLVAALLDTFAAMPPGEAFVSTSLGDVFTTLVAQSFQLGVRGGAPAVAALLLSTLALAAVSRALPQLQLLSVGLGLNALVALAAVLVSAGAVVWLAAGQVEAFLEQLVGAITLPAGGGG